MKGRHSITVLTLAALAWLAAAPAQPANTPKAGDDEAAQQERNLRSLYVTVQKGEEKLVGGLQKGNFEVLVDGEPVEFRLEEPENPATIGLLVEFSRGSWFWLRDILSAMSRFVEAAPEGHWYGLSTFAREFRIAQDFTKQRGEISQALSTLRSPNWDEINTYDALYEMLDRMGRMRGRRILIFVGSGFDTFSSRTLDDVLEKAEEVNVTIFALGAGSSLRGTYDAHLGSTQRLELLQAQNFLESLAKKTGGWARFPRFEQAYPEIMKGVMQMIEFQYKIVYEAFPPPQGDDNFREVEVKAFARTDGEIEEFKVYAREGWRY